MIVRRVEAADWQTYKLLRLRALELAPDAFGTRFVDARVVPDEEWRARVKRFATDTKAVNFLAYAGDTAVGMVSCFITDKAEMVQMWVEPEARGARVAEQLVEALVRWLRDARVKDVFADVYESNTAALKLYLRIGFKILERVEEASAEPAKRIELKLTRSL